MFLQTDKVAFRQLEESDLPQLRDWRNDIEVRKRAREFAPLNLLSQKRWFDSLDKRENIMFLILGDNAGCPVYSASGPPEKLSFKTNLLPEKPIGVCGVTHIDWKNRSGELSWYIGNSDFKGKRLARHINYLLCQYCFLELCLHRFFAEVYVIDDIIVPMYEHLGFKLDGLVRDTYFWDGRWYGSAFLSILSSEWETMRRQYL